MANGEVIERQHAKTTFIEVIEKLGLEKVMSVDPSTVLTKPPKYSWVTARSVLQQYLSQHRS